MEGTTPIKSFEELTALEIGETVQWPALSDEHILTLVRKTNSKMTFRSTDKIGVEIPLKRFLNYPMIISFPDKSIVLAPIYKIKEWVKNGKTKEQGTV